MGWPLLLPGVDALLGTALGGANRGIDVTESGRPFGGSLPAFLSRSCRSISATSRPAAAHSARILRRLRRSSSMRFFKRRCSRRRVLGT